jgi:hypothetical protein
MKFVKDNRIHRDIKDFKVPVEFYEPLRLSEQKESVNLGAIRKEETLNEYVNKFLGVMKPKA